jgi:hypothetical protein
MFSSAPAAPIRQRPNPRSGRPIFHPRSYRHRVTPALLRQGARDHPGCASASASKAAGRPHSALGALGYKDTGQAPPVYRSRAPRSFGGARTARYLKRQNNEFHSRLVVVQKQHFGRSVFSLIVAGCSVFSGCSLERGWRCQCSPVPKSQKIIDLALSPIVILGRERIDAGID